MVFQPQHASKNILGYSLKERIGSGGFGEVWSAIAPGGMMKAVKIVYGYHDEKRAQAELKALDRVKEVRHPFLLSLERIEIHEGQLIVVTELAEKSMADLYNEHVLKNEQGIHRDDLLKYIRNVADALDYLSDEHGLQHLDVKPENLLMVSGHVKVADFGLIKDLQDQSQSLISGMTPAYAAPELFDGRPGTKSDQYSLAIVYQEMLTSLRPFPGTTPAQLAAQHLHGKPNLHPLPKSDRHVIARALSKDPGARYENCRAMAEELVNRKRPVKKAVRRIQTVNRSSPVSNRNTAALEQHDQTVLISDQGLPFQASQIESLDPPECDASEATMQPVLIVGVGATANRVVKHIKRQMVARHNSMAEIPAVRLLCIDTDRNEITQQCLSQDDTAFTAAEALATPLRKPEVYREQGSSHLNWLSRRWIYNIPRTLQTEGLRPLGRLAFADHFEPICKSIDAALTEITQPENIAETADEMEMNPGNQQPRVFIVSSISGGVGSGMTLDLAYTIKVLMAEHGLKTDKVIGILLHSTYQRSRDAGLAAANAFAFMTELRQYVENGYPGDASVGLPEFEDEPPFDYTYFNEVGHNLSQTEFEHKLCGIAEYIYLSATSNCSTFFDKCREMEVEQEHFSLRTFGLSVSGPGDYTKGTKAVNHLAYSLVQRWINGKADSEFNSRQLVSSEIAKYELTPNDVSNRIRAHAKEFLDYEAIAQGAQDILLGSSSDLLSHMQSYLDGALGCPPSRKDSSHLDPEVCLQLDELLRNESLAIGDQISTAIFELLSGSNLELSRAKSAVTCWNQELAKSIDQLSNATILCEENIQAQLLQFEDIFAEKARNRSIERQNCESILADYCQLRLEEFILRHAKHFYRGIRNGLVAADCLVSNYLNSLCKLVQNFVKATDLSEALGESNYSIDNMLHESIEAELENHVSKTEIQIYESVVRELGGYRKMLDDSTCLQHRLPSEIQSAAQRVLADAYKKISLESVIAKNNVGPEQLVKWLNEKIRHARPVIDDCGGSSRIMLGIPALTNPAGLPEMFQRQFGLNVKAINGTRGSLVICFEVENISLANVAYRLLRARPDAIELVKRIHTRNDIEWSTLNDLF